MFDVLNCIGGELKPSLTGRWLENKEPATGNVYSRITRSDERDVAEAVSAARQALPAWSALPASKRAECINRLADAIAGRADQWALAESRDNGKPISLASTVDIPRAEKNLRFFASAIHHFASDAHLDEGGRMLNYTHRKPVGIVGCISPWNLPLYLFTWKVAPALAAGNCVIAKPSEVTPVTAYLLSTCLEEAGIPPGVFNFVHGLGAEAGEAIVTHPEIKAISFTGGTSTGKHIQQATAGMFKKLSLELGGKNPALIFPDCDLDLAVKTTVRSAFANQGQICLCTSRILIHEDLYDRFRDLLVQKASRIAVGDPEDASTRMGAVVSQPHRDKVLGYIEQARALGGTVLCGGGVAPAPNARCAGGYFIQPTIIEGLDQDCPVIKEEIFGPVITLQSFRDEAEALALANGTEYGLTATIWTNDLNRAHRVAGQLETGIAWINCWLERDLRTPFGGVKSSGVGREGGWEALRFFTEPQNVCIRVH